MAIASCTPHRCAWQCVLVSSRSVRDPHLFRTLTRCCVSTLQPLALATGVQLQYQARPIGTLVQSAMHVLEMGRSSLLHVSSTRTALCSKTFRSARHAGSLHSHSHRRQQISCQAAPAMKTALVTGANSGIGFVAARELAQSGYNTVLACRDLQKAKDTKERIL
jgi:short chain dehydrogenase